MKPALPIVVVEKPRVPTIWLDTCVVSDIVEALELKTITRPEDVRRAAELHSMVGALVEQGRLLCPRADQEEESQFAEKTPGLADAIARKYDQLSLGVRMKFRSSIEQEQVERAMEAQIGGWPSVFLPVGTFFRRDPHEEFELARQRRFVVAVRMQTHPALKQQMVTAKEATHRSVRELKTQQARSFEEHVADEEIGMLDAFDVTIDRLRERPPSNFWEFNQLIAWGPYLHAWATLGGNPAGVEGFRTFLSSEYVRSTPYTQIRARLWADILAGKKDVRLSDAMDIDMLAAVVPAAHFVVTDRKMAARLQRRGIDRRWGVRVFSLKTVPALLDALGEL